MFAGWITFSAFAEDGLTYAQAQVLMRASDPMSLAAHAAVAGRASRCHGRGRDDTVCVDRGRQWSRATNIWHNAGIRSGIYMTDARIRLFARPFRRGG